MVVEKRIMIFQGKKIKYNKLILKALYENGNLSAWRIARTIADSQTKPKTNWYHKAQKVQSVLIRKKGGRLIELLDKDYIQKTDGSYRLTFPKGFCTALTLYKDLIKPAKDPLSDLIEYFPEIGEAFEVVYRLYPEAEKDWYIAMLRVTERLLEKGLNFDVITNKQFQDFFNSEMNEFTLHEELKKEENKMKWNENPELQKSIEKLMNRMKSEVLKQLKKIEEEVDSFEIAFNKRRTGHE